MSATTAIVFVGLVILTLLVALLALVWRYLSRSERQRTELAQSTLPAAGAGGAATRTTATREGDAAPGTMLRAAEAQAQQAIAEAGTAREARRQAEQEIQALQDGIGHQRVDIERRERRLAEREERLDSEVRAVEERAVELNDLDVDLARRRAELLDVEADRMAILERISGLTVEEAKAELVALIENDAKRAGAILARDIEREAVERGEERARRILTTVIQRLASEQTAESVVSVVQLPGDDMKGRIIGREGRNIRAFEQTTGVNLIIDDTPEAVLLSCFDPVRRETARFTLEELVADGRIHPSRIEEIHDRSRAEIERLCTRAGEDALVEVGITDLHPVLVHTLGQLRYRTSYGQNVLRHLVESAFVAGMMADELGLDRSLCMRAALLHDIGKALTHEVEGSHAIVGAELAKKYGETDDVVHAIEAHHNEVEPRTVEAILTQAADAISGGRPGARRESLEVYVHRLQRLEEIALDRQGVEKVFAMQAGREVRVMVMPNEVDDIQAQVLARDIAKQVEEELTYPGQIRVTVVRESRASEVAR
jgi:ribonuclease Y